MRLRRLKVVVADDHGLMIDPNGCPGSQEEDGQPASDPDAGWPIDPNG